MKVLLQFGIESFELGVTDAKIVSEIDVGRRDGSHRDICIYLVSGLERGEFLLSARGSTRSGGDYENERSRHLRRTSPEIVRKPAHDHYQAPPMPNTAGP